MTFESEEEDRNLSLSKFESMLKTNKVFFFDSEEFEDIILHYLDIGKANLAKKALKIGLDQHPRSTGLKLVQVEMLIYDDKLDQAEKLLNELYAIEPTNEEVYIQRANVYSKRDKHDLAVEMLNTALQYTDDRAEIYNLIGMEYLFLDDLEQAKTNFIKCLEEDYEDQSALYNVVYCFEFLDQYNEAIDFLKNYIDKNPYSEIAWHQMGRLYYTIQDYQSASVAFEMATHIDDEFIGAYMEFGKSLERLKRYEEAIFQYNQTIELGDPTSYVYLRIGKCYEKLGNKNEALKYFNKTVHEDPLLDKGWVAITDFYLRQKNYRKALYFIKKALNIDDQNRQYWKRFGTINLKLNNIEESEFGFRKAVELGDFDLETWMNWIDLMRTLGEFNNGILALIQAAEYFPDLAEIEFRIAGFHYMLLEYEKGNFHLANGLRLNTKKLSVLEKLFPNAWEDPKVQEAITKYKNL